MILLIAIVLIFIVLSLLNFFQPKGSLYYYDNFLSMAQGACYSTQSASNMQFNSNPNSAVFQIYDNATCDNALKTTSINMFSPSSPYDSSSLENNYDLCYGQQSLSPNAEQYFYSSGIKPITYTFDAEPPYSSGAVNYLTQFNPANRLGMPAISVTASANDQEDTYLNYSTSDNFQFTPINRFSFAFTYYANISSSVTLFFGQNCQFGPYSFVAGNSPLQISTGNCDSSFKSVEIQIQPNSDKPGQQPAINYQLNLTASSMASQVAAINNVLFQQCMGLAAGAVGSGIEIGTVVCSPIKCGSTSFILSDTQDRPFLALFSETYPFLGVQAASSFLQIINPNSALLSPIPIIHG